MPGVQSLLSALHRTPHNASFDAALGRHPDIAEAEFPTRNDEDHEDAPAPPARRRAPVNQNSLHFAVLQHISRWSEQRERIGSLLI
jgi:hypothetical protein